MPRQLPGPLSALEQLAGGEPGQLVEEADLGRALVVGQPLAAPGHELAGQGIVRAGARLELHEGDHPLAHLVVGDPDDTDVVHRRVQDQDVLGLAG